MNTDARRQPAIHAKLAFLSQPSPGVFHMNLQFENGANLRVDISKAQLGNILVDGTAMALREPLSQPMGTKR